MVLARLRQTLPIRGCKEGGKWIYKQVVGGIMQHNDTRDMKFEKTMYHNRLSQWGQELNSHPLQRQEVERHPRASVGEEKEDYSRFNMHVYH